MPGTSHENIDKLLKSMSAEQLKKMKTLAEKDPKGLEKILREFGIHDTEAAKAALRIYR